ncbi:hypothetical protein MSAN_02014700 [Mycena sanguinolenta]|uniref:Cell wall galactomannoprotein n=1 Tax=Mycena sanguinolenta TaxID=230812 RepID=A0A8H7CLZ0_9AGAR|nr:hypothetical protein MSAN_02014700 [Mycena sanguinolenta]
MAPILSLFFALFIASVSVAAPVEQRQIGDLACNIDRVKILTDLVSTGSAVGQIDTSDPATATAVAAAQSGLKAVGDSVAEIALALVTGAAAPADARTAVSQGLNDTRSALESITNPAVSASVAAAQSKLQTAIDDGNAVLADCN